MVIRGVTDHTESFWDTFGDAIDQIHIIGQIPFLMNIYGAHTVCQVQDTK